jgi:GT2 family glycosyltransferase
MAKGDFQCIVTDDSADENTREMVSERFPWVVWTAGPQLGPAANRNHGARLAKSSWIVFTDDDCLPGEDWLRQIVCAIQKHPEADVIEGRTTADREQSTLAETAPFNDVGGNLWSCNLSLKRDRFLEIGGFDEKFPFPAMEDVDLALRIKNSKMQIFFASEALVIHPWRKKRPVIEGLRYQKSVSYFKKKHPNLEIQFSAGKLFINVVRSVIKQTLPGIIKHRGKGFSVAVVEHLMGLLHAAKTLCSRQ